MPKGVPLSAEQKARMAAGRAAYLEKKKAEKMFQFMASGGSGRSAIATLTNTERAAIGLPAKKPLSQARKAAMEAGRLAWIAAGKPKRQKGVPKMTAARANRLFNFMASGGSSKRATAKLTDAERIAIGLKPKRVVKPRTAEQKALSNKKRLLTKGGYTPMF